jgi:hypothetical protein
LGLLVSGGWNGTHRIQTSDDGITWTARTIPTPAADVYDIIWAEGLGLFIATLYDNGTSSIMTSPDGINWTERTTPGQQIVRVAWSEELQIAVALYGNAGGTYISSNGITWTTGNSLNPATNSDTIEWIPEWGMFIAGGIVVAPAALSVSFDGVNWESRYLSVNESIRSICYAPELNMLLMTNVSSTASEGILRSL